MWITLKPFKTRSNAKETLKGNLHRNGNLYQSEGSCTERFSSATQPLWSPPVPRASTQLRLSNEVPAASPQLPHATQDISNPKIQLLGASKPDYYNEP